MVLNMACNYSAYEAEEHTNKGKMGTHFCNPHGGNSLIWLYFNIESCFMLLFEAFIQNYNVFKSFLSPTNPINPMFPKSHLLIFITSLSLL